ncbi:hypothetical protein QLQ12_12585 [Actinoplanes sp. NEAU-A12]|uniref:Lipoprotein n=1 Tax=Actinoplanes sandaracinus TaxID=3045177 RepID=A0ABT6WI70_9ACTN|nr:hypothetical protein [Actinoplanes sandaracinus]MDI6099431.1 hypothetical protein [Actinoplanes sandaracinus]
MRRIGLGSALALITLFGVTACGAEKANNETAPGNRQQPDGQSQTQVGQKGEPPQSGERLKPLIDQFKEARSRASSDFEKATLDRAIANGKITATDYEEAFSRYRQCAKDSGVTETYTKEANGFYRIDPPAGLADIDKYLNDTGICAKNAGLMSIEALYRTQVDNPGLLADPRELVVRCLVKAGLVGADYTPEQLMAFIQGGFKNNDFDARDPEAQKCFTAGGMAVNVAAEPKGGA